MSDYNRKIHQEILTVMDAVKKVCDENSIKYYIVGGTLLGAVRHKGFIPWDDDLDIAMPRQDFNRFIKICNSKIEKPYKLLWTTTRDKYWYPFAKVHKEGTMFVESTYANVDNSSGVYIDIFPLDEVPDYNQSIINRKKNVRRITLYMKDIILKKKGKGLKARIKWILENSKTINEWNKKQVSIMARTNGKGYSYYANFGSYYSIKKQTLPKEYYGEGITLSFEGRNYTAPSQYEKVLISIYGNNYMELPPLEKRITHYPIFVRFSDKSEYSFDISGSIINVLEK